MAKHLPGENTTEFSVIVPRSSSKLPGSWLCAAVASWRCAGYRRWTLSFKGLLKRLRLFCASLGTLSRFLGASSQGYIFSPSRLSPLPLRLQSRQSAPMFKETEDVVLIVAGFCSAFAVVLSSLLIRRHLMHFSRPVVQVRLTAAPARLVYFAASSSCNLKNTHTQYPWYVPIPDMTPVLGTWHSSTRYNL